MSEIEVFEATDVDSELLEAFDVLTPQLSSSSLSPTIDELAEIVDSPATVLLMARDTDSGQIVGSTTLVLFRIPTGVRAWIEDVVVDESVRRRGVGAALNIAALNHATEAGAMTVDLTSRPARKAANRLYKSLGFVQRDTNVYRYKPGR